MVEMGTAVVYSKYLGYCSLAERRAWVLCVLR